jgi:hypothetical protein
VNAPITIDPEMNFAYAILGSGPDPELGSVASDFGEMVAAGQSWILDNMDLLQTTICRNKVVKGFIRGGDIYAAVGLVMELIPGLNVTKAGALSLLAAKGLLNVWCSGCEE